MAFKAYGLLLIILAVAGAGAGAAMARRSCGRDETAVDTEAVARACAEQLAIPGPVEAPTEACCAAVRAADVQCVCTLATPELERRLSMAKLVYVATLCRVPVPAGTKCGHYLAPPGAIDLIGVIDG